MKPIETIKEHLTNEHITRPRKFHFVTFSSSLVILVVVSLLTTATATPSYAQSSSASFEKYNNGLFTIEYPVTGKATEDNSQSGTASTFCLDSGCASLIAIDTGTTSQSLEQLVSQSTSSLQQTIPDYRILETTDASSVFGVPAITILVKYTNSETGTRMAGIRNYVMAGNTYFKSSYATPLDMLHANEPIAKHMFSTFQIVGTYPSSGGGGQGSLASSDATARIAGGINRSWADSNSNINQALNQQHDNVITQRQTNPEFCTTSSC